MEENNKEDKWYKAYPDKELREIVKFQAYFFRGAELRIRKEKQHYFIRK